MARDEWKRAAEAIAASYAVDEALLAYQDATATYLALIERVAWRWSTILGAWLTTCPMIWTFS
jgi:hypothetical protein